MKSAATMTCNGGPQAVDTTFRKDVIKGLSARQKFLEPKYFYDAAGDKLFQDIMNSPEYYLTGAEMDIMRYQSDTILDQCLKVHKRFDIGELGAGDATKTVHLLRRAVARGIASHYYPIDISKNVISYL